jgi:hypothetical protein
MWADDDDNMGMPVAPPSSHPAGELVVSTPQNKATLSRQNKAGRALRVAPGLYVVGASLPPEKVVQHHRFAIIAHHWPGAVLCDRTALAGGQPSEGWMFIAHPLFQQAATVNGGYVTDCVARGSAPSASW